MRYRQIVASALLLSATMLGGCHSAKSLVPPNLRGPEDSRSSLDQAKQALQQATPCCSTFADLSFQNTLPWKPKKFELGPGSLVASINGDRSYFLSFSLPREATLPYRIAFKAALNGRWLRASYLFAPTVVILDDAFQPISSQDVGLCEHMGWTDESTGAFGSVEVTDKRARYLVLYSSAKQQSGSTYWEQSPAAFSAEAPVKMAATGTFKVPHGPDGTVWLGMMDKTYQGAVDNAICAKAPQGDGVLNTLRDVIPLPTIGDSSKSDTSKAPSGGNAASNGATPAAGGAAKD
ncbi:MalM family protein [Dyella silvae]|uniref:MalM family protein n=1 Tax=Dyella silvae TaxID=2994424 RepID=UPI00226456CA|nr:MalM family protein [Dyella silvae]